MVLALDSTLHDRYRITFIADTKPDGAVYRAMDRDGRRVLVAALPQLDDDELAATAELCQHLSALSVEGLLPLRDHFAEGRMYYLVCDDPGGQDLERYVREWGGPMPETHVLTQIERLLVTLENLHSHKPPIFLGDLRGSDLWSNTNRDLILTPFALARPVSEQDYGYRAPELAKASEEADAASDMYSFGVLFYQMLTGWMPPTGVQREAGTPLNAPRMLNGQVSALAEQAVLRSLELKKANRYQAAHEMRQALKTVHIMGGRSLGMEASPRQGAPVPPSASPGVPPPPPPVGATGNVTPTPSGYQPAPAPGYGAPPPAGYPTAPSYGPPGGQPMYAQPYPAQAQPQRRSNTCLIIAVVLLAFLALLVVLVFLFVLLGPARALFGGVAAPASTAAVVATSGTTGAANTANPSAITLANAATITETKSLTSPGAGPVSFAPNGATLAVGLGKDVLLRDATSLEVQHTLSGHTGVLITLAFSPDSATLASGAIDDTTIRLWNAATGQSLREIKGEEGWIRTLAFSPDGSILASGSTDKTIRLWNPTNGTLIRTLQGHTGFISRLAFSPDGTTLASTSRDGTVRLWDVGSGTQKPNFSFTAPNNPNAAPIGGDSSPYWMTGLAFSPDGTLLAAGSIDHNVRIWNVATGALERTLQGHENWVMPNTLAFAPDGKTLASGSLDGTIRLWDPATGAERGTLTDRNLQVLGMAFDPKNGMLAATSDEGGSLDLWDLSTQKIAKSERLGQGVVTSLAYSSDGALLATSGMNGTVRIHLVDSDREMTYIGGAPTSQALAFIGSQQLAALSDTGSVLLLTLTQEAQARELEGLSSPALSIAVSPDGATLAAGTLDGKVGLWNAKTGQSSRVVDTQSTRIATLAFSSDGKWLAVGSSGDQPQLMVIDVTSGEQKSLSGYSGPITALAFQPNSKTLASTTGDGTLRLWDATNGQQQQSIQLLQQQGLATSIAFSPDGTVMATGTLDGSVTLWNVANGEIITALPLYRGLGSVLALTFRPNGEQLAASIGDGSVRLLGLPRS